MLKESVYVHEIWRHVVDLVQNDNGKGVVVSGSGDHFGVGMFPFQMEKQF